MLQDTFLLINYFCIHKRLFELICFCKFLQLVTLQCSSFNKLFQSHFNKHHTDVMKKKPYTGERLHERKS